MLTTLIMLQATWCVVTDYRVECFSTQPHCEGSTLSGEQCYPRNYSDPYVDPYRFDYRTPWQKRFDSRWDRLDKFHWED